MDVIRSVIRPTVYDSLTRRAPLSGWPGDPIGVWLVKNGLEDSIGVSSTIVMTTGTPNDLMAATFSVPYEAPWIQADTDEGGDVFFDSANSNAPIVRSGAEWYDMLNGSYVWIGPHPTRGGVAVYTEDMISVSSSIQRYLGYYTPTESAAAILDKLGNPILDKLGNPIEARA